MRLRAIALSIAFAISASALPRTVSERNFKLSRSTVEERAKEDDKKGGNSPDPQSSLSEFDESCMVFITRLHNPSSVGQRGHLLELQTRWAGQRDLGPGSIPDLLEQLYQLLPDGQQASHERPADQGGFMQSRANGRHRSLGQHAIVQVRPSEEFGRDQGKHHFRDQDGRQASRDRTFRQPRFELFRSATAAE